MHKKGETEEKTKLTGLLSLRPDSQTNSVALVRKRTIPTEGPPLVGEVSANFSG
jgi:hypothetical protein